MEEFRNPRVAPHNTHFHQAILVNRNKLLAMAHNSIGSRSKGAGYSDMSIHAERAVVKRLGDISQLRGATMYVVRFGPCGEYRNSKPCHECKVFLDKCMREYGLRKVVYSMTEGIPDTLGFKRKEF
jgi:hypothetical protein